MTLVGGDPVLDVGRNLKRSQSDPQTVAVPTFCGMMMEYYLLEKWIGLLESSLTEEEKRFAEDKESPCVICSLHESVIGTLLQGNVSRGIVLQTCVERSQLESKPAVPVVLGGAQLHRTVQHLGRSIWVVRLAVSLCQQAGRLKLDIVNARKGLGDIPGLL